MNTLENTTGKLILKPGREKSILNKHPWVFSGAIHAVEGQVEAGDILPVYSHDGTFLAKGFYNPNSQIRLRILTFEDKKITLDFFREQLLHAIELRKNFLSENVNAFRCVFAEADGLPGLIVDKYADTLVLQFQSLGMYKLRSLLVELLRESLSPGGIVNRTEGKVLSEEGIPSAKEILWGEVNNPVVINEYGHQFYVDVMEGQKTGFFLDQRENRRLISNFSKGKKVLNCFSYSGGFSVYAAKQGAITTSVDVSAPALELAQQNFQLNHLSLEGHNFVKANVFEFLREDKERYDVVILDPPAFAKQKKDVMKASRGYKDINRLAMEKFNEEGLLLTCSCSSFIDRDLFRKIIFAAAKEANCRAQILAQTAHPIDHPISVFHPEGEYLKALLLRITR